MPFNGSGTFQRSYNWVTDKNNAVKITASRMDAEDDGFATGLSNCITKDGQSTPTANIPMGGFKLTGLGDATTATDALNRQTADARYLVVGTNYVVTDVASATTTDIGAAATERVRITGTTTITSFGTGASKVRFLHFADVLTLTHNATSLILPTAANIITRAGDAAIFSSDGSGNWRCLSYQRANGEFLTPVATVASASTTDIGGAASSRVSVTGTTTITSLGSIANAVRFVSFTGALTLTHNATSLILPSGANITTAAGDCAIFSSDSSANWRCLSYQTASGLLVPSLMATASQFRANTSGKVLTTDQVWSAADEVTLTDGTAITPDFSTGINFTVTLAGNRTLENPTNAKVGQNGYIRIVQDGTGSRTLAYGTNWKFAGAFVPTLTTTANRIDFLFYTVRSSSEIVASLVKNVS